MGREAGEEVWEGVAERLLRVLRASPTASSVEEACPLPAEADGSSEHEVPSYGQVSGTIQEPGFTVNAGPFGPLPGASYSDGDVRRQVDEVESVAAPRDDQPLLGVGGGRCLEQFLSDASVAAFDEV